MFAPGTIIYDRYTIHRLIGRGGMGAIYEAFDQRLNRIVAVKEMLVADEPLVRQFMREAQILARLHHPALPVVSDFFVIQDVQFLVMEYIAGETFAEALIQQPRPFPVAKVLNWADTLLDVLSYLHRQTPPIIHRDIKPQNIKLTPIGQVVLLDFGLAKGLALQVGGESSTHSVFGYTFNYAPIEQIQGKGTDARSDVYALGATLYTLLAKSPPIPAPQRVLAMVRQQSDPLPLLSHLNPTVPVSLAEIIQQMLAIEPADRPSDSAILRTQFQAITRATHVPPHLKRLSIQSYPSIPAPTSPLPIDTNIAPIPTQPDPRPNHRQRSLRWWWFGEVGIWILLLTLLGYTTADTPGMIIALCFSFFALIISQSRMRS